MSLAASKLGDNATIVMGQSPPGESYNKEGIGAPLLNGPTEFGTHHPTAKQWTTSPTKVCKSGDVLFCVRGATAGRLNVADKAYCLGRGLAAIRPKPGKLDRAFLLHTLANGYTSFQARGVGSTFINISSRELASFAIPLFSVAEQQRIAAILDKADALRAKRRDILRLLNCLAASIFVQTFGDPHLPRHTIGDLLHTGALLLHKDGNHGSLYPRTDDFSSAGVPFLSAKAITDEGSIDNNLVEHLRADKAEKLRIGWIEKGDVLLAHNASVGKVGLYDGRFERALIGTSLTAFRPNPGFLTPEYLASALKSADFQAQLQSNMGQTTRNQVPITGQRALQIVLPSLDLQKEFANRITTIDRLKSIHDLSVTESDSLFGSLQYRAFRGEL